MIREYFEEKQRVIDTVRKIYNHPHHEKLLIQFSRTKDFVTALEMDFVDAVFHTNEYGPVDFDPVWTKKAHKQFLPDLLLMELYSDN